MLCSGIDLHKRTIAIHTLDAAGTFVRKADLPTQPEVITAYFAQLQPPSGGRRVHRHVVLAPGLARATAD